MECTSLTNQVDTNQFSSWHPGLWSQDVQIECDQGISDVSESSSIASGRVKSEEPPLSVGRVVVVDGSLVVYDDYSRAD